MCQFTAELNKSQSADFEFNAPDGIGDGLEEVLSDEIFLDEEIGLESIDRPSTITKGQAKSAALKAASSREEIKKEVAKRTEAAKVNVFL